MPLFAPKKTLFAIRKACCLLTLAAFIGTSFQIPVHAQEGVLDLPKPGVMVHLSPEFTPAHLNGVVIHPDNALQFDFLIQRGEKSFTDDERKQEYQKLIKYFLASLTIPENHQWVNLSPYEKDRIVQEDFGNTEMGRDLLAQDYILKQITSSLIYPEDSLGKKFWDKIYERAWNEYHTTNIPVNTFNKVWIVPDEAAVYESGNKVIVLRNHLKVMLEGDYLSLEKHVGITSTNAAPSMGDRQMIGSQIIKEIILPELEREVNEGANFSTLRQIYSGMILATWYKKALKESLLGKVYADQSKVQGINLQDPKVNEAIYQQYLAAFKKGVFNYIKEDVDKFTRQQIPRKYFSGGAVTFDGAMVSATQGFKDRAIVVFRPGDRIPGDLAERVSMDTTDAARVSLQEPSGLNDEAMVSYPFGRQLKDLNDPSLKNLMEILKDVEKKTGLKIGVMGGVVRDLYMGRSNFADIDLVFGYGKKDFSKGRFTTETGDFSAYVDKVLKAMAVLEERLGLPQDALNTRRGQYNGKTLDVLGFFNTETGEINFSRQFGFSQVIESVNSMVMKTDGGVLDFYKAGEDLSGKKIRLTGNLSKITHMNVLRLIRLQQQFGFEFDAQTQKIVDTFFHSPFNYISDPDWEFWLNSANIYQNYRTGLETRNLAMVKEAMLAWDKIYVSLGGYKSPDYNETLEAIRNLPEERFDEIKVDSQDLIAMMARESRKFKAYFSRDQNGNLLHWGVAAKGLKINLNKSLSGTDKSYMGEMVSDIISSAQDPRKARDYLMSDTLGFVPYLKASGIDVDDLLRQRLAQDAAKTRKPSVADQDSQITDLGARFIDWYKTKSQDYEYLIEVAKNAGESLKLSDIKTKGQSQAQKIVLRWMAFSKLYKDWAKARETAYAIADRLNYQLVQEYPDRNVYAIKGFNQEDVVELKSPPAEIPLQFLERMREKMKEESTAVTGRDRRGIKVSMRPAAQKPQDVIETAADEEILYRVSTQLRTIAQKRQQNAALPSFFRIWSQDGGYSVSIEPDQAMAASEKTASDALKGIIDSFKEKQPSVTGIGRSLPYDEGWGGQNNNQADIDARNTLREKLSKELTAAQTVPADELESTLDQLMAQIKLVREGTPAEKKTRLGQKEYAVNFQWTYQSPKPKDQEDVGGIDLNAANLDLQIKRDGQGIPLPLIQQDMNRLNLIQGFVPVILEIRPASQVPLLSEIQSELKQS